MLKSYSVLFFFVLTINKLFSQTELNDKYIHSSISEVFSSTEHGGNLGTTSARRTTIFFKVGENGKLKSLDRKGKKLFEALSSDSAATKELKSAYKCLRRKKLNNTLEVVSTIVGIGSVVPLALGANDGMDETGSPINTLSVVGAIGTVAGFGGLYYFKKRTDKFYNLFIQKIKNSIDIYNNNLKIKNENK